MAMQRARGDQVVPRHVPGAGLLHPRNIRGAVQIGQQAGRYLRETYDRYRNDRQEMQDDNRSEPSMPDTNAFEYGGADGGGGSTAAFRGKYTGDLADNPSYAEHYLEIHPLHSRKRFMRDVWWTLYQYANTGLYKFTGAGQCPQMGVLYAQGSTDNALPPWTARTYNYSGTDLPASGTTSAYAYQDYCDDLMAWTYNPQSSDFIDNKLINNIGNAGIGTQYAKFRLVSFTVEIVPKSWFVDPLAIASSSGAKTTLSIAGSGNNQLAFPVAAPPTSTSVQQEQMIPAHHAHQLPIDYWFYRDTYNKFLGLGSNNQPVNGGNLPLDWNQQVQDNTKPQPTGRTLRNMDQFNECVKNGEKFSYTREVKQKANYFIPYAAFALLANPTSAVNMQMFIAQLEGLNNTTDEVNVAAPLYESFNIMMVPTWLPYILGSVNTPSDTSMAYAPWYSQCKTVFHISCKSTWEAFDFDYNSTNSPGLQGEMITMENSFLSARISSGTR